MAFLFATLFAAVAAAQIPSTAWYDNAVAVNPDTAHFVISTADELAGFAQIVNKTDEKFIDKTVTLANDIDLSVYDNWTPIGPDFSYNHNFGGTFDGNGHKISGLRIYTDSTHIYVGLFGNFYSKATIRNLGLVDVDITNNNRTSHVTVTGGIAGRTNSGSVIENCFVTGKIRGVDRTGAIVGYADSRSIIRNCYSAGTVEGISELGGIIGWATSGVTMENCYSVAEIVSYTRIYANCYTGGLVGYMSESSTSNSAALNPVVSIPADASDNYVARVAGLVERNVPLTGNLGFSGTLNRDNVPVWKNIGSENKDGKDIYASQIIADSTLGGLFTDNGIWKTKAGSLPVLFFDEFKPIPEHLKPVSNALKPAITVQPSDQTAEPDEEVTFSVLANLNGASVLRYWWQVNDDNTDFKDVSYSTTGNYTISSTTTAMNGNRYRCIVTNESGLSDTSDIATLTVRVVVNAVKPVISTQPSGATVNMDTVYNISVNASVTDSGTLSYQWYENTTSDTATGTLIPGATASVYRVPTSQEGTKYYYVTVTNTNNKANGEKTASIKSRAVLVTVKDPSKTRDITIVMRDSYGDGWNNASLRININGTNLSSYPTVSSGSSSSTYRFSAVVGDVVTVYWNAQGNYPSECAFAVYYTDDPPSPAFNPASGTNDADALLVYRLYENLSSTATGTVLGSFTVVKSGPRVAVSPQNISLPPGGIQTFTASTRNITGSNKTVSWSVTGNSAAKTSISSSGVLTVSADETASTLIVTAVSNANPEVFGTSSVTIVQPYKIGTAAELAAFADSVNAGRSFSGRFVVLTANIDLSDYGASNTAFNSGRGWKPIGTASYPFRGEFNGNGHVISNLYINNTSLNYAGLFGYIGTGSSNGVGFVKNVGLENVNITAGSFVGGVAGRVQGYGTNVGAANQIDHASEITNCYVTGSVKGTTYVGGIAGQVSGWGLVSHSYSTAEVNGNSSGTTYTGGIAGDSNGEILNCAALNPSVKGGISAVGRIVGSKTEYAMLSYNIAYDEMLNRSDTSIWSSKSLTSINGSDISASTIHTDSTLGGRFEHAPWVTAKGFLPAFGTPAAIPKYISNEPATVTSVTVSPDASLARRGKSQTIQFKAVIEGTRRPSQAVTWSVYNAVQTATTINANGLLTISPNETAASLTIKAVSVLDPTKFDTASVLFLEGADMSNPVAYHGRLSVKGNRIYNQHGDTVQLRGMSFFWSMAGEGRDFYNADVVNWLADDWKVNVVRAAMGVDEIWRDTLSAPPDTMKGYLAGDNSGGVSNKKRLTDVVDAAIAKGIYVIIDWHSHMAHLNRNAAITFFREMAQRYKDVPNVLYEIYNEPCAPASGEYCGGNNWANEIKPYSQAVVDAIREIDPHNIIIIGTPTWSQDVDVATASPIVGNNLVYTLHFYAASHGASLRSQATAALNRGYAIFVSEFGTCRADGAGSVDTEATNTWLNFLDQSKISWVNWSISDKPEAASALKPGTRTDGNWTANDLTLSGTYIRNKLRKAAEAEFFIAPKTLKYRADVGGLISGDTLQSVKAGSNGREVTAIAATGYNFIRWSDGSTVNPRTDKIVLNDITVTALFERHTATLAENRIQPNTEGLITAPVTAAVNELTAGPNPVSKQNGNMNLFWQGSEIRSSRLFVYDAAGNVVSKRLNIKDALAGNAAGSASDYSARRLVGSWNLRNVKGRPAAEGTYLIKGTLTLRDGTRHNVSLIVGVR